MSATSTCTCGCSVVTTLTRAAEPCGCGCACCAAETPSRDEEIAHLRELRASIEDRLAHLDG